MDNERLKELGASRKKVTSAVKELETLLNDMHGVNVLNDGLKPQIHEDWKFRLGQALRSLKENL
jgi:hypothetical protein